MATSHKDVSTSAHSTAHDLGNKGKNGYATLTHKKQDDTLVRNHEQEGLVDKDNDDEAKINLKEAEHSGSLSGADTWNFILLVILCTSIILIKGRVHSRDPCADRGKKRLSALILEGFCATSNI
jgi:hypothetical protein